MLAVFKKKAKETRKSFKKKIQNSLHFTKTHEHYLTKYDLNHQGDYLFIHDKISAKKTFHRETKELAVFFLLVLALALFSVKILTGLSFGVLFVVFAMAFYFLTIFFKALVFYLSVRKGVPNPTEADLVAMEDKDLPIYTVMVAAYKESGVMKTLIKALNRLEYPRKKLDIKLLLEENDKETIQAVENVKDLMGPEYDVIVLPDSHPKTKPKALNVGLMKAKGDFLAIYDAEDIPEPNQLKKAVWLFNQLGENTVTLQAKLNFYNPHENLLSKWFTAEYTVWFEYVLPGLHVLNLPIPLGGTSNHFRTSVLREVGGWDPYNVTEDADLGMRLSRLGYNIAVMESTTWEESISTKTQGNKYGVGMFDSITLEESNSVLSSWINQRSRWVKGFMQTFLVHFRHPIQTIRDYSWRGLFTFIFIIGGTPITHILNLIFWAMAITWLLTRSGVIAQMFPEPLLTLGWISLIVGNSLFVLLHVWGPFVKDKKGVAKWSLLIPVYWLLMALATLKAAYQLFFNPHYWEKTEHGVSPKQKKQSEKRWAYS